MKRGYTWPRKGATPRRTSAGVAQLVEHVIRNDGVGGSSPFTGTSEKPRSIGPGFSHSRKWSLTPTRRSFRSGVARATLSSTDLFRAGIGVFVFAMNRHAAQALSAPGRPCGQPPLIDAAVSPVVLSRADSVKPPTTRPLPSGCQRSPPCRSSAASRSRVDAADEPLGSAKAQAVVPAPASPGEPPHGGPSRSLPLARWPAGHQHRHSRERRPVLAHADRSP